MNVLSETKHLAKGSALPPLTPGRLRLYSMKFCPFAQRTRLVLVHKNIPHEVINVNLKHKPKWLFEKNPKGLVPILEQDNRIVFESLICDEYLEDMYPEKPLRPSDPYIKARQNILEGYFEQVLRSLYSTMFTRNPEKKLRGRENLLKSLEIYETELEGKFYGGDEVGMLDFHLWPWIERIYTISHITGLEFSVEKFPKMNAWIQRMYQTPAVKATALPGEVHAAFLKSLMDRSPNYEIEVPASRL
ncbi:glutathione S-transferase omega-1 isoform X2 [Lingula anatina]|uniref:Glutathione S-transferase omega n=1 Tax=Lingula anatina TaxID=7574 RepID=A0A1S3I9K4_LINAN|nr:glutathione S-transferase omega-1 isoform X2 [Lingula anatina]|eukprot:XP_013394873.1 glutathione S-transferase omega-1 isoform X2 [Lingula anatina]